MIFCDHEAERHLLSGILHSEIASVEAFSCLSDDDFDDPLNRQVFLLAHSLFTRNIKPTLAEVLREGHSLGFVSKVKDVETLRDIASQYIHDDNTLYWAQRIKEAKKSREAKRLMAYYIEQMKVGNLSIDDYIANIAGDFYSLGMDDDTFSFDSGSDIADLGEKLLIERTGKYREQEETTRILGHVPMEGVPTGIKTLDVKTLGLKPGELAILGALTGHGKTAFAINISRIACIEGQYKTLYINTEMSRQQIARRWGAVLSGVPLYQIQSGSVTNEQKQLVIDGYKQLAKAGFLSCSAPNLTPNRLEILARKAKIQFNIDLLILDYVGRMEKITPNMAEWQVLEQIVKSTKILAQNLEIAVLVLVQLNSDGSLQGAKRMENESDLMLKLLQIDKEAQEKLKEKLQRKFEDFNYVLYVQKARDAESGITIPLVFDKERQRIHEAKEIKSGYEDIGQEIDYPKILRFGN